MEDRLQLDNGGPTELLKVDESVVVRRQGARLLESLFLLVILILCIPVLVMCLVVVGGMLWVFLMEARILALLLAIVFGFGLLLAGYAFLGFQGMLFPFKVVLTKDSYRLENGLLRLSRTITRETAQITIFPVYNRGDWGYVAKLKITGKKLALPLIPVRIIGTKYDALCEAQKIREWLRKNSPIDEVVLQGWGDPEQIQPGVEYIR